jgi:hypothetical protein
MAAYDSDSSDGEFEETNVLLGYASKDADDDVISRIGGQPVNLVGVIQGGTMSLTMCTGLA